MRIGLGVRVIHRDDQKARAGVHYAMQYLVKNDQQLRLRPLGPVYASGPGRKIFVDGYVSPGFKKYRVLVSKLIRVLAVSLA